MQWDFYSLIIFHTQAFGEYIDKLLEVMEKKANSVNNVIAQVQTYMMASHASSHDHLKLDYLVRDDQYDIAQD